MNKLDALKIIVGQAERGELIFPTNISASLKLQQALDNPECRLEAVTELVLAEPLIATRLVAIGNSVAYTRFGGKVNNVRSAVSLLGLRALRSLVAAIIVRQLSSSIHDPAILEKAELLWQHSANVAALAKVIARELTEIDPETALFAGIVHEISGFYLISRAEEFPALLNNGIEASSKDDDLFLAHSVMQVLKVPKPVMQAVESLYAGRRGGLPVTLGDILALANDLASVPSPLKGFDEEAHLRASASADLMVKQNTLGMLLAGYKDEIKATLQVLLA